MSKRLVEYRLAITDGDPPERSRTSYETKASPGELDDIACRIKPGQHVTNLSGGSLGKLKNLIRQHDRSLKVIVRRGLGEGRGTLYVPSEEWWKTHPRGR